jgi:hypothetical protein
MQNNILEEAFLTLRPRMTWRIAGNTFDTLTDVIASILHIFISFLLEAISHFENGVRSLCFLKAPKRYS